MMNNFEPRYIKMASRYLSEKLKSVEKVPKKEQNVYIVENKKESLLSRIVHTFFGS